MAEPADERARIVRYLRHAAMQRLGTVLSEEQRMVVGWCASWAENRLDERWERELEEQGKAKAKE